MVTAVVAAVLLAPAPPASADQGDGVDVLVFTAVEDPEQAHASTSNAVELLEMSGRRYGMNVDATADAAHFTAEGLADYDAVVWLNTYGEVLDETQQVAFQEWMSQGGGFVGVHGAARTHTEWAYFHELVGAAAVAGEDSKVTSQTVTVDNEHPATEGMPDNWEDHSDQWYSFDRSPAALPGMDVLATVPDGQDGERPVAWCRSYDGGRAWYTALGHTVGAYQEADFMRLLRGGILWAADSDTRQVVNSRDAAPAWPYELSFLAWIVAVALGGGIAVTQLNRREAAERPG